MATRGNIRNWKVAGLIAAVLVLVAIFACVKSAPPAGYTVRIKHAGDVYYAKDWRFDETHRCVVFADQDKRHRVLCGDYSMENVK